ncbi:DUF1232 domain-containing protein [Hydrogenivirga sp. 128-5-R1-1]|uniref:YkvA family protein n=1 Tax=Hydrogenivirga sp. 128-5-R1-1 TaxID=392423 RepID=UPI00015EF9A3|nr:DUF1232 domain-containing protein [Hydrogenivirga sp. 128-5-R1-1]EDP75110.1 hypothetical protein HG1285_00060 [Hydrogenivirga sp. 128-5-R1-1]
MSERISEDQIRAEFERLTERTSEKDIEKAVRGSDRIYDKVERSSVLSREIGKVKLLLMLIKDYWNGDYTELPYRTIVAVAIALLYILNPIDLIPDVIPILGQMDDLAMLMFVWKMISEDVKDYALWKVENTKDESLKKLIAEAFGENILPESV